MGTCRQILLSLLFALGGLQPAVAAASPDSTQQTFLSPSAAVATTNGRTLFLACSAANQIAVFDVRQQQIERHLELPGPPSGLVLSADERRLFVTCAAPESLVCVLSLPAGKIVARLPAGHTAMAPVLSRDGRMLFVCARFDNAVVLLDLETRRELARIPVEREPVAAALTPDGQYLFVANHIHTGPSDVGVVTSAISVIDIAARKVVKTLPLPNGSTMLRGVCVSPDGKYVAVAHILARFHLPTTHVERGWMNDNALSLIDVAGMKVLNTVLLDDVERGAANPWAVAWSADAKYLCVTHAGTHELSLIDAPRLLAKLAALPARSEGPPPSGYSPAARVISDVPNDLAFLVGLRKRIQLGGNGPRALALAGGKAFIGHAFSDSLSVVELTNASPAPVEIPLHPPMELSAARQGEMYFNDGTLCFQGWQSCGSCHSSDARVDGMNWDLLNDGIGNPKNVKSLLLSFQTPPVMSMGVRADAGAAIRAGIRYILFADLPEKYPAAIDEYIKGLKPIPSPQLVHGNLSSAARRGKKAFNDPAVGCVKCHQPPLFTDLNPHDVGTGKFDERTDTFYTPTLIEAWRTAPYLHDGSAPTIRDAITIHNRDDRRGRTSQLTTAEVDDLVAYVLSL